MQQISLGILGCNEEYGIAHLLDSLETQTLLKQPYQLEIIVISNGSQDQMAQVARTKLAEFEQSSKVVELPVADKCAAWNQLIHRVAQPADCYILLDADIVLAEPTSLETLLQTLIDHPECRICGGKVANSRGEITNPNFIDGKCYAIRGDIARNIYIPDGIVLDDAYIAATAITNWYEISQATGEQRGYARLLQCATVQAGHTPRDRNKSYWIASRKRTITARYTQKHIDYCMRSIFGGGELAKTMLMKLSSHHPNWFTEYLNQVSVRDFAPPFHPPDLQLSLKQTAQFLMYCYCYLLSVIGIRNQEFGHLAWKLKHRYW
jgi:glycosyltransferase involved in cell wall biosynthesis